MSAERCGRPAPARAGLTLIEVLLAFALLGGGLAVLIAATAQGLGLVRQTRQYQTARLLLDAVAIDHPLGDVRELVNQVEEGSFDPPYDSFRWSRVVLSEDEDDAKDPTYLYQVRTRVRWSDRGRESGEELVTCVFMPEDNSAAAATAAQPELAPGEAAQQSGRGGRRGRPDANAGGAMGGRRDNGRAGPPGAPGGTRGGERGTPAMNRDDARQNGALRGRPGAAPRSGNAALPTVRISAGAAGSR